MLSDLERRRYNRHILLPDIGEDGQKKLLQSTILIVGLGGLGSPAALYLAAAGIGKLLIADGDELEISNLQRQVLFDTKSAGDNKADLAAERLNQLNPDIDIEAIDERLEGEELTHYVAEATLVLDCCDNLSTRRQVNRACKQSGVPLVTAAAIRWEGHLSVFDLRDPTQPCYECLYPVGGKEPVLNCSTSGVAGPMLGILGAAQALEALKVLLDMPSETRSALQILDGKNFRWQRFKISKSSDCPTCSQE